jgi:hypothetical protein
LQGIRRRADRFQLMFIHVLRGFYV